MKNLITLTIFVYCLGVLQSLQAVSGARIHESPPRIRRQLRPGSDTTKNSANYVPYSLYRDRRGVNSNSVIDDFAGGKQNDYYDPFFYMPAYPQGVNGARSRRNSRVQPYMRAAGSNQREYLYERNSNVDNNNIFGKPPPPPANHRVHPYSNPNTFLTKSQVTGEAASRNTPVLARYYFPQSNSIDYRKPNYYDQGRGTYYRGDRGNYESARQSSSGPEEAWSIQVGTQLKVKDDGRERNPEQFYVRDEQRSSNYNRRYPTYYRK